MHAFLLCFVPLFVAVDPIGVLPMFAGLTQDMTARQVRSAVASSLAAALAVSILFLLAGTQILSLLGISMADFMVAGGILLLILSVNDLLGEEKSMRQVDPHSLGAVPLGVPLIAGPAVLATVLLLNSQYGLAPTALALLANLLLIGGTFLAARRILGLLGNAGAKIVSKISSLLLAAIAVMLIRKGVVLVLTSL